MHPMRVLAPQPLRIAGETLIEPNVIPLGKPHRIAKPLVAELVGNQAFPRLIAQHMILPKMDKPCASRGISRVFGDHHGVVAERVGAKQVLEELEHGRLVGKINIHIGP